MAHNKFHLGYFTKFGPTSWPGTGHEFGSEWANGSYHIELAKLCEAAKFDFVMFEDGVTVADKYGGSMELDLKHAVYTPKHDPLPLLPLMAHATSRIGFIATASTTFYTPYLLARSFSTLDSLTSGRAGWNIVTSSEPNAARNFGHDRLPPPTERYDIADEFVEVTNKLWDSWEEGALVADPATGVYVDHTKVHTIDFVGKHYRSRGPLNTLRSPQGRPVLCQAGASARGRDFAAKHAEVVLGIPSGGVSGMREFRDEIRGRMAAYGRNPDDCKILYLTPVTIISEESAEMSAAQGAAMMEAGLVMGSASMDIDLAQYDLDAPVDQDMVAGGHTSVLDGIKALGREGKTLREALAGAGSGPAEIDFTGTPEVIADKMIAVMDEVGGDGFLISGNFSGYNHQLPALFNQLIPTLQNAAAVRTEYSGRTLREVLQEF